MTTTTKQKIAIVSANIEPMLFDDSYGDGKYLVDGVSYENIDAVAAAYRIDVDAPEYRIDVRWFGGYTSERADMPVSDSPRHSTARESVISTLKAIDAYRYKTGVKPRPALYRTNSGYRVIPQSWLDDI